MRLFVAALAALAIGGSAALAQPSAERGGYLVNTIGACSNCHTPRLPPPAGGPNLERRLSGGFQTFNEPFFTVKGSNLTPDRDTGIGAWSDADIKRALTEGVRPNGVPLAMVMPYNFLRVLTPNDLDSVVAYLRTLPAIKNEVQLPVYKSVYTDWNTNKPDWMPGFVGLVRSQLDKAKAINNHLFGLNQFVIGKPIWETYLKGQEPDPKVAMQKVVEAVQAEMKKGG